MALRRKGGFAGAATVAAAGFVGAALTADPASAAFTIDFGTASQGSGTHVEDPFTFSAARLERDNCAAGACLALNKNESTTMSLIGGGTFDLLGLTYNLLGDPAELTVTGTFVSGDTISKSFGVPPKNTQIFAFSGNWSGLEQVVFDNSGKGGNVRVDDISAVPLPAAAWMFLAGLGVVGGVIGRRRRAAAAAA